jgi:hypothetical protein
MEDVARTTLQVMDCVSVKLWKRRRTSAVASSLLKEPRAPLRLKPPPPLEPHSLTRALALATLASPSSGMLSGASNADDSEARRCRMPRRWPAGAPGS